MLNWIRREPTAADTALDPGSYRWRLFAGETRECAAAVLWDLSAQSALFCGDAAHARSGRHPRHHTLIRPVQQGVLADFDAGEALARELLQGIKRPQLLAALPGGSSAADLQFFAEMLREAGAASVCLVPATACVAAACTDLCQAPAVGVVELGHEVVQASVYSRGSLVAHRQQPGGGGDLYRRLREHLLSHHYLEVGFEQFERLLPHLYCGEKRELEWFEVAGKDLQSRLPRSLPLAYWELSRWIEVTLQPIVQLLTALIEELPPAMLQQILQDGLMLGGGFSQLQGLPEYLQEQLGLPLRPLANPSSAVTTGLQQLLRQPQALQRALSSGQAL